MKRGVSASWKFGARVFVAALCAQLVLAFTPVSALAAGTESTVPSLAAVVSTEVEWTRSGTCEWSLSNGQLVVRPADGASGELVDWGDGDAPWAGFAKSITSVRFEAGVSTATCRGMFLGCSSLKTVDLSVLDTSSAVDMQDMFWGCSSLETVDLSRLNTSSVKTMARMFYGCSSLVSVNLSDIDTSSVTNMWYTFYGCSSLGSIDLSRLDTSSVTEMGHMFYGCSSLGSIDLSGLNTSSVTDMSWMLSRCSSLGSIVLSGLDTSSVTDMSGLASECSSLRSADLSGLNTSNVKEIWKLFYGCGALARVDVSGVDLSSADGVSEILEKLDCLRTIKAGRGTKGIRFPASLYGSQRGGCWVSASGSVYKAGASIPSSDAEYRARYSVDSTFYDVNSSTPHATDIEWLVDKGITTGFIDGSFRPYDTVKRCDMAAFLYRIAGSPDFEPDEEQAAAFKDVDGSTAHRLEVLWLASEGISTGFSDGSFRPYDTVKRCDMAAFLYRIADSPDFEPDEEQAAAFKDVDGSTAHRLEVLWLASEGISMGFSDGTFRPYETVKRCDMAAFLRRMSDKGFVQSR